MPALLNTAYAELYGVVDDAGGALSEVRDTRYNLLKGTFRRNNASNPLEEARGVLELTVETKRQLKLAEAALRETGEKVGELKIAEGTESPAYKAAYAEEMAAQAAWRRAARTVKISKSTTKSDLKEKVTDAYANNGLFEQRRKEPPSWQYYSPPIKTQVNISMPQGWDNSYELSELSPGYPSETLSKLIKSADNSAGQDMSTRQTRQEVRNKWLGNRNKLFSETIIPENSSFLNPIDYNTWASGKGDYDETIISGGGSQHIQFCNYDDDCAATGTGEDGTRSDNTLGGKCAYIDPGYTIKLQSVVKHNTFGDIAPNNCGWDFYKVKEDMYPFTEGVPADVSGNKSKICKADTGSLCANLKPAIIESGPYSLAGQAITVNPYELPFQAEGSNNSYMGGEATAASTTTTPPTEAKPTICNRACSRPPGSVNNFDQIKCT